VRPNFARFSAACALAAAWSRAFFALLKLIGSARQPPARVASYLGSHEETDMIQASQIVEHMEVVGSDGGHVGRVDHVMGDEIELTKLDLGSGLKHHLIPLSWVDHVGRRHAELNLTKDAAKAAWREKH
jgi:hypothetical protein